MGRTSFSGAWLFSAVCLLLTAGSCGRGALIELNREDAAGRLRILIEGREALVFQYAASLDLPHYLPMNSPSGRNLLVGMTEPYPHHRSFWFADTFRLNGSREVSTYNALYSGNKREDASYRPPFRNRIRHRDFTRLETEGDRAVVESRLVWEMDGSTPMLEERRRLTVISLGEGEYLLDLFFELTAAHGAVEFVSDDVHYAWPYLRMHPRFSGENGGTITSDKGAVGQEATNMQVARWMDYSNTLDGVSEGVAVFQWPDGEDRRWLTREYGCFGPRRPDVRSGKPFTLEEGASITQRVGVLVHTGDVTGGRVALRYLHYISGEWD